MVGAGMSGGSSDSDIVIRRRSRDPRISGQKGIGSIRRWMLRTIILVSAAIVSQLYFPKEVDDVSWSIRKTIDRAVYRLDVEFLGLSRLRQEDLEVVLPVEKPFWWWLVSAPTIEKALVAQPLVKSATVSRCAWYSLKCFQIAITERQPVTLVSLQSGWWLVGDDGGVIGPVSTEGRQRSVLPIVLGSDRFETTPQVLREKLLEVLELLNLLKGNTPRTVTFSGDSEVLLGFESNHPEVLLELGVLPRVVEQLTRLAEVSAQLGERLRSVRRIDLAFQSQAVVTFQEPSKVGGSGTDSLGKVAVKSKSAR